MSRQGLAQSPGTAARVQSPPQPGSSTFGPWAAELVIIVNRAAPVLLTLINTATQFKVKKTIGYANCRKNKRESIPVGIVEAKHAHIRSKRT